MAVTSAEITALGPRRSVGDLFSATRTITFDSSYVTGGEPATAAQFGLTRILRAELPIITTHTTTAAPVIRIIPLVQGDGSLLLKAEVQADAESDVVEASSTLDLSGLVAIVTVYGY